MFHLDYIGLIMVLGEPLSGDLCSVQRVWAHDGHIVGTFKKSM